MSVGYDHIDLATAKKNNIKVGYTPDVLTDATADLTVLLTLAAARKMKQVKKKTGKRYKIDMIVMEELISLPTIL